MVKPLEFLVTAALEEKLPNVPKPLECTQLGMEEQKEQILNWTFSQRTGQDTDNIESSNNRSAGLFFPVHTGYSCSFKKNTG